MNTVDRLHKVVVLGMSAIACASAVMIAEVRAQVVDRRNDAVRVPAIMLLVRPRVGDTLRLQMEQTIEVSSRPADATHQGAPVLDGSRTPPVQQTTQSLEVGPRRNRTGMRITRLLLYAHSLVESSDLRVTTLLASTDSMSMWAGTPSDMREPTSLPLPLEGRQVRVRVTPDGAMRVSDPPPGAMELGATLASMPGLLPPDVVRVGDRWERDIALPSVPLSGYRADGTLHARFRLDSLTHRGRDAWISLEGSLRRDGNARELPPGTRVLTNGTMRGTLLLDRQRAWIVDALTVMDVQSEVTPTAGSTNAATVLDLRIEQRIRAR